MCAPGDVDLKLGDAFGDVLQQCWRKGGRYGLAYEIAERDDGFISVVDAAHYLRPPDKLGPLDQWACEHAVGRVLDVGCGAARQAVALMASGHEVIGIDPSPGAVEIARARGVQAILGSVEDDFDFGIFDTVLMLGNNLGLLADRQHAGVVLRRLADLVRPGGRLIGSGISPAAETAPEHVAYQERNRMNGRMPGQLRIRIRHRSVCTPWFDYLHVSVDELASLANGTGWALCDSVSGQVGYAAMFTLETPGPYHS
jgi:SAM-dependent methyltransferase